MKMHYVNPVLAGCSFGSGRQRPLRLGSWSLYSAFAVVDSGPIFLEGFLVMFDIFFRFPAVFGVWAVLPSDQEMGLSALDLVVQNAFYFKFFFSVDDIRDGRRV
jgi:hypothetical protein